MKNFLPSLAALRSSIPSSLYTGFVYYYMTSLVVFSGLFFGVEYLKTSPHNDAFGPKGRADDAIDAAANWDGKWYLEIAKHGYSYDPFRMSSVAFFPAYPMLGSLSSSVTGVPHNICLLVLSQLFFWATLVLIIEYTDRRFLDCRGSVPGYTALAVALCPAGVFFRVTYSESMFLFLVILTMYGLLQKWPIVFIALIVGFATGTRAMGVALIPPLVIGVWQRTPSLGRRATILAYAVPLSCWGLFAYMLYQACTFGQPLAFSQTQSNWRFRPEVSVVEHIQAVITLEPIAAAYDADSPGYWRKLDKSLQPPFSIQHVNPIYLCSSLLLIAVGVSMRWLNFSEAILAAGLLLIPYITRGYYGCMLSQARFSAVAFPTYIVVGHILSRTSEPISYIILAVSGCFMGVYTSLFAGRYFIL